MAKDLCGIKVLLGGFYYAENRSPLMSQAQTTGR
jgi:hypothetical protein